MLFYADCDHDHSLVNSQGSNHAANARLDNKLPKLHANNGAPTRVSLAKKKQTKMALPLPTKVVVKSAPTTILCYLIHPKS